MEIKMSNQTIQKIIFGSPGTGKSYMIDNKIIPEDLDRDINEKPENVIKAVFHPEYTNGDFMGKLLPMTKAGQVEYNFYEGHFLKALSQAYKNILKSYDKNNNTLDFSKVENVALVIDEINRGNSSAIFGSVFQLLDRDDFGWSNYKTNVNGVMYRRLLELIGGSDFSIGSDGEITQLKLPPITSGKKNAMSIDDLQNKIEFLKFDLINKTIQIPPNLSIIATMNTSDSSIYYMDSAFKRRWDWEFMDINSNLVQHKGIAFKDRAEWESFVHLLNRFIKSNNAYIRGIEDKQIGHYFIKSNIIEKSEIQSKLMFFIWDSVFTRDKKPLLDLLGIEDKNELVTFGDFVEKVDDFIKAINRYV